MEQPELKNNKCLIEFFCHENRVKNTCQYRKGKGFCDYFKNGSCQSLTAQVNRMIIYCKSIGIELKQV